MNEANKYAQSQADAFRETLQYLVDTQNEQKRLQEQLAATNYQNMLDKINANKYNLNATYEENARQAYVNKLLGAQEIGASMSRMGLSDSGFRATQDVLNNNQYSANLNKLALARAAGLEDIGNQEAAALGDYNASLLGIQGDANDRLLALNKYIEEQVQNKYDTEYSKFFANQQYQNQLAQQQWERNFAYSQLNNSNNSNNSNTSNGFVDGATNGNTNNTNNGNNNTTGNNNGTNTPISGGGGGGGSRFTADGSMYDQALREARALFMTPKGGNLQAVEMLLATYLADNRLSETDVSNIMKAIGASKK